MINNQLFGVASTIPGSFAADGLLGLGPVDLTQGTVTGIDTVPTVTDNLLSQGLITSEVVGISFRPGTTINDPNGELTFGGIDSLRFTGNLSYTAITQTAPSSSYWGIDLTISYDDVAILCSTGIVDTGTTTIMLASDTYAAYLAATGAVIDTKTGLPSITTQQYESLQSMYFTVGETTYELTANGQLWPRSFNAEIGGDEEAIYLAFSSVR